MFKNSTTLSVPRLGHLFETFEIGVLRKYFGNGLELPFLQSWMKQPEEDFQSGRVQLLWDDGNLHVLATFEDEDIVGLSSNGMMRSLCVSDIFQIFVQGRDPASYLELHLSPDNQCKLLQWNDDLFQKFNDGEITLEEILVPDSGLYQSRTWIEKENNSWAVYVALSTEIFLSGGEGFSSGKQVRVGFCRFDTSPSSPQSVLSATCAFEKGPLFHQREYWHELTLA